jgi:membrane-bound inhibitor of C-type lysozyme
MFSSKRSRVIAGTVAAIVIAGGSYGIVAATSSSAAATAASSSPASGFGSGGGSNARSGPAAGGTVGTVTSLSTSGFAVTTSASEKATVKETSSTSYEKGTSPATASAVTTGSRVLVLGTDDNTTITASQVIVDPPATSGSNPGGQVIPYSKGESGSTQQVGQIPSEYTQGSGTIVSGTTAAKATEAALAAYPGGIVDRVVAIGNGDYEVHNIGVNWPHHIFENRDFQVIGAND